MLQTVFLFSQGVSEQVNGAPSVVGRLLGGHAQCDAAGGELRAVEGERVVAVVVLARVEAGGQERCQHAGHLLMDDIQITRAFKVSK